MCTIYACTLYDRKGHSKCCHRVCVFILEIWVQWNVFFRIWLPQAMPYIDIYMYSHHFRTIKWFPDKCNFIDLKFGWMKWCFKCLAAKFVREDPRSRWEEADDALNINNIIVVEAKMKMKFGLKIVPIQIKYVYQRVKNVCVNARYAHHAEVARLRILNSYRNHQECRRQFVFTL